MEIQNYFCHDCNKEIEVNEAGEIMNGNLLKYKLEDGKEKMVFKCADCYAKDQSLRNYQETEVYSRVVGYIRPVSQWNEGKQQEFGERKTFNV
ncbi:MAG: anaerobic ribonucleoside-triphosphate reductase [Candidatus Pacebacteria bacterium]|nr:anaerobic ribonucleoside-triphosphate reductase [Candidatus Paceibacterota bacterium]